MTMFGQKASATTFGVVCALFGGFVIGHFAELGSDIEMQIAPHSSEREIIYQKRTPTNICWTQRFDKYRPGAIQIWNYHLSDDKGNVGAVTPMRAQNLEGDLPNSVPGFNTGDPPKTSESTPVGNGNKTSWCINIPSWVTLDSTITVTGIVAYDGPTWPFTKTPMWMDYFNMPTMYF